MASTVTMETFRSRVLRDTFSTDLDDRDAFLLFALLHYYQIEIAGPVISDRPSLKRGDRLAADTQRGCAETLAAIWSDAKEPRASSSHWYSRWNTDWGAYGHAECLSPEEKARIRVLIEKIEQHPFVIRLTPEDDGLLD